jgi:hypothetical protein
MGRDGARREVAWETLDAGALTADQRRVVGTTWRERMRQEHLAVGAFSMLAYELAADGADPAVLSLVTRAASDEVRHAEICRRMAVVLLGDAEVPAAYRGVPRIPPHRGADRSARVLLHVVEMCCLSETLTGVYFTEMVRRATQPAARAAVESLLEDEIDHGRVGWAYLASRVGAGRTAGLAEALPALVARVFAATLEKARRDPDTDDPGKEALGYLGATAGADVLRRTLADVVLPGFDLLGIDTAPTRAFARDRGWI